MNINATVIQRSLPQDLADEINSVNDWSDTIWGPSYVNAGFTGSDKGVSSADLFMLFNYGVYQVTGRYKIEVKDQPADQFTGKDLEPAADKIFQYLNLGEPMDGILETWAKDKRPSMSVGDLVYFEYLDICLICCGIGWRQLTDAQRIFVNQCTASARSAAAMLAVKNNQVPAIA